MVRTDFRTDNFKATNRRKRKKRVKFKNLKNFYLFDRKSLLAKVGEEGIGGSGLVNLARHLKGTFYLETSTFFRVCSTSSPPSSARRLIVQDTQHYLVPQNDCSNI
jgi:hypothetical protein